MDEIPYIPFLDLSWQLGPSLQYSPVVYRSKHKSFRTRIGMDFTNYHYFSHYTRPGFDQVLHQPGTRRRFLRP